jgi:hypothetical protein
MLVVGLPRAALAGTGSISGRVTDQAGSPVPSECVDLATSTGIEAGQVLTDATGSYTLTSLPDDQYRIQFLDCDQGRYLSQWFSEKDSFEDSNAIPVTGNAVTGIDAEVVVGGTISGRVTDGTGTPMANVSVGAGSLSVATDSNGSYSIHPLPTGDYAVEFTCGGGRGYGSCVTQWYNNKPSPEQADLVSVTQGSETSGIDATMVRAATIAGHLTDLQGSPAAGDCVTAWSDTQPANTFIDASDETGSYELTGLPPDTYTVSFGGCDYQDPYPTRWYNGKSDQASADRLVLSEGEAATGIDAVTPKLDHLAVSPSFSSIAAGGSQTYTVEGFDKYGNGLGSYASPSMPSGATFTMSPDGTCSVNTCSTTHSGAHTVYARYGAVVGSAALQVGPGLPSKIVLSVSPQNAIFPGSTVTLSASLVDAYGNGVPAKSLRAMLRNPLGFLVASSAQTTDAAGRAKWVFSGAKTLAPGTYAVQVQFVEAALEADGHFTVGP